MTKKVAMWSGPRNLSTAMMYSFAQRSDCEVWDEPFYAAYLSQTGVEHPMRKEILGAGEKDAAQVIARCLTSGPNQKGVFYQKHMTQHMIEGVDREWILGLENVFLIRHPARVLASYDVKRSDPTLDDIGFSQQIELVEKIASNSGSTPLIIDSADVRMNPEKMLRKLCKALGLEFETAMLSWPLGGIPQDGAWAPHWYGAVWNSTGFAGSEGPLPEIRNGLQPVLGEAQKIYDRLSEMKVKP